jgi:hypothetical protein
MAASSALASPPTFTHDVASIFYRRCVRCHRHGEIGRMPLVTYRDARPYAKAIREQVMTGQMPPWPADPRVGALKDETRLLPAERAALIAWVEAGAPEGTGRPPATPRFTDGWTIGKPDLEIPLPREVTVPATGAQANLYFEIDTGLGEDRWVTGIEIRPGNRRVVHHLTVFVLPPEAARAPKLPGIPCTDEFFEAAELKHQREAPNTPAAIGRQYLFSWTPGSGPYVSAPDAARFIPAGSRLRLEVHYAPTGKPEVDRSRIGLIFAKQPPARRVATLVATNEQLAIPPGEARYEAKACMLITRPVRLTALKPHMHLRGHDIRFDLRFPDGRELELLSVPRWDFDWQLTYTLKTPLELSPGTRLEVTAHYDNSAQNRSNPDPSRYVIWDEQSTGEMLAGMLTVDEPR